MIVNLWRRTSHFHGSEYCNVLFNPRGSSAVAAKSGFPSAVEVTRRHRGYLPRNRVVSSSVEVATAVIQQNTNASVTAGCGAVVPGCQVSFSISIEVGSDDGSRINYNWVVSASPEGTVTFIQEDGHYTARSVRCRAACNRDIRLVVTIEISCND